jgi:thioredoxin-dependent peroxiredoxin
MANSESAHLQEGDRAPGIDLEMENGERFSLSSAQGKKVVLFFYPKADTPGCTKEACGFRDARAEFGSDVMILGISPDKPGAQLKFKTKYGLPYNLLADVDHSVAEAYGVWKEKSMYGKKHMGIDRTTFIIGPDGRIEKIFRKVKPDGHAAEVLEAVGS